MRGGGGTGFRTGLHPDLCGAGDHSSHTECVLNTGALRGVVILLRPCCRGIGIPCRRGALDLGAMDRFELAFHPRVDFRSGEAAARHQIRLVDDAPNLRVGAGCNLCAGAATQQQGNQRDQVQRVVGFPAVHARYSIYPVAQSTNYIQTILTYCRLVKQFCLAPPARRRIEGWFRKRRANSTKHLRTRTCRGAQDRCVCMGSARPAHLCGHALRARACCAPRPYAAHSRDIVERCGIPWPRPRWYATVFAIRIEPAVAADGCARGTTGPALVRSGG